MNVYFENIGLGAYAQMMPTTRLLPIKGSLKGAVDVERSPAGGFVCTANMGAENLEFAPNPRLVVVLSLLFCLTFTPALQARQTDDNYTTYYAAIAFSQSTGRWGYSSGFSAEVNARRQSLKNCVAKDCKVVLMVGNGYAALALGDDTSAYGFGHSKTDQGAGVARRFALDACNKRTKNCKIAVSIHSWAG